MSFESFSCYWQGIALFMLLFIDDEQSFVLGTVISDHMNEGMLALFLFTHLNLLAIMYKCS